MSFGIIVKDRKRESISRENKTEHRWERRVKMLSERGYSVGNIHAMMDSGTGNFPPKTIEKMLKHEVSSKEMNLSGKNL